MNCKQVDNKLGLLIDKQLSPVECLEMQNHLKQCAHCQAKLTLLKQSKQHIKDMQAPLLSDNFDNSLAAKIAAFEQQPQCQTLNGHVVSNVFPLKTPSRPQQRQNSSFWSIAAAASLTIIGLGYLMLSNNTDTTTVEQLALEQNQNVIEIDVMENTIDYQPTPTLVAMNTDTEIIYWSDVEVEKFDQFTQMDDGYQNFNCGSTSGERGCSLAADQMVASLTVTNI